MPMRLAVLAALLLVAAPAFPDDLEVPAGKHGSIPAYIPEGATKEKPVPLLVLCHGHGDSAKNFLACTKAAADKGGYAILAPEGIENLGEDHYGWNNFPDRGATIEAAIRALLKDHPEVDPKRIVWLGHSAGSWVCCEDGASRPELCRGLILTAAPTADPKCPAAKGKAGNPGFRVCLFLGTKDPNFRALNGHVAALKAAKVGYSANQVKDLEHALPSQDYLATALHWVLDGEGADEENVLFTGPPEIGDLDCRHILIRHKGALGAGDDAKLTVETARKEALKLSEALRKEKPAKRLERKDGALLTAEAVEGFGPLMRWACWSMAPGEVRVVRTPAGFHVVWADR